MKTIILAILIALSGALRAEDARLTPDQVKAIVNLVTTESYPETKDLTPSTPRYDKTSGVWSCINSHSAASGGLLFYIRDKDAYFRVLTTSSMRASDEFKMPISLKRRIAKIVEKKG